MIRTQSLSKTYTVPIKKPGLWGSMTSLWNRQFRDVHAVRQIDFQVEKGERVGFLGPNGAGKTTTLKMLTGLLHPSEGTCEVAGFRPADRAPAFLQSVTLVMGQKQQLPRRRAARRNRSGVVSSAKAAERWGQRHAPR